MMVVAISDYGNDSSASHSLVKNIPECTKDDVIQIVVKTQIVRTYVCKYICMYRPYANTINGVL